jgi:hypothetical protein
VFASSDIRGVKYDTTTLAETALVNGSDFTVSGAGNESTGVTITPSSSIPSGTNWVIYSDQGSTQTTDLQTQGPFLANTIEYMSDKLAIAIQEVEGKVDRAYLFPLSHTGSKAPAGRTINTQTGTTYTLTLADDGAFVEMNNASANTVTVPPNADVAFDTGTTLSVFQYGAGVTTIAAGAGVTIRGPLTVGAQYAPLHLYKRATNEWVSYE